MAQRVLANVENALETSQHCLIRVELYSIFETNAYLIMQHQDQQISEFLPEVKFSIAKTKLLHKRMVRSKLFAFFKYFTNLKLDLNVLLVFPFFAVKQQ